MLYGEGGLGQSCRGKDTDAMLMNGVWSGGVGGWGY